MRVMLMDQKSVPETRLFLLLLDHLKQKQADNQELLQMFKKFQKRKLH